MPQPYFLNLILLLRDSIRLSDWKDEDIQVVQFK